MDWDKVKEKRTITVATDNGNSSTGNIDWNSVRSARNIGAAYGKKESLSARLNRSMSTYAKEAQNMYDNYLGNMGDGGFWNKNSNTAYRRKLGQYSDEIDSYLYELEADGYGKDDDIYNALTEYKKTFGNWKKNLEKERDAYGNLDTQIEYDKALRYVGYKTKYDAMTEKERADSLSELNGKRTSADISEGDARKYQEEYDWILGSYEDDAVKKEARKNTYEDNKRRIAEIDKDIASVMKRGGGIARVSSDEVQALKSEKASLEAENTLYRRTQEVMDKYSEYTKNEDFGTVSARRDIANPSKEELITFESRNANAGYTLDAPIIEDKLGMYLSSDEKEREEAYGYQPGENQWADTVREGVAGSWSKLTEGEVETYYYILNSQGKDAADKYLSDMTVELNRRENEDNRKEIDNAGTLEKIALNVASVPANVYGGVVGFAEDVANTVTGKDINPYSAAHGASLFASNVRDSTSEAIAKATEGLEINGQNIPEFLYQTGMSMAESMLGAATMGNAYTYMMGMNAAASEAKRLYEEGASKTQIAAGGLLAGAAEAVFEKLSLDRLLKEKDIRSVGQLVKEILAQGGVEASEEVFTEITNKLTNQVVMGANSDYSKAVEAYIAEGKSRSEAEALAFMDSVGDVIWAGAGGFLSGAGMGAAFDTVQYHNNLVNEGRTVIGQKGTDSLKSLALEMAKQEGVNKDKLTGLSDKVGKKASAKNMGKLSFAVENASRAQNIAEITRSLKDDGMSAREAGKTARTIVDVAEKNASGTQITQKEYDAVTKDKATYEAYSSLISNPESSVNKRNDKYALARRGITVNDKGESVLSDALAKDTIEKAANEVALSNISSQNRFEVNKGAVNAEDDAVIPMTSEEAERFKGKTTVYDAETDTHREVKIAGVQSIKDGEMMLKLDDGSVVNARDVRFASDGEAVLYNAVLDMGVNAGVAQALINNYDKADGVSAGKYVLGIRDAYFYGKMNIPLKQLSENSFAHDLTAAQREFAYKLGQTEAKAEAKSKQKAIDEKMAEAKKKGEVQKKSGKLIVEDGVAVDENGSIDESVLTDVQKANLIGVKALAELSPINFHVFRSEKVDGEYRYTMPDGSVTKANGVYMVGSNDIWIDLNSGDMGEGTMLWTASHEISHYIKERAPVRWKAMADYLVKEYSKKQDVSLSELLDGQKSKVLEREGSDSLSEEEVTDAAYEELVSDALSDMLTDGSVIEALAEIKKTDKGLWQTIKDAVAALLERWGEVLGIYKGRTPDAAEAQALSGMKEAYKKLQKMYAEAFAEANAVEEAVGEELVRIDDTTESVSPVPSERNKDSMSNRAILANAIESSVQTEINGAVDEILQEYGSETSGTISELATDVMNTAKFSSRNNITTKETYTLIGKEKMNYEEGNTPPDLTLVEVYNERTGKTETTIKFVGNKPKDYVPKKIAYCYKLFEQHPDGTLHALFAGASDATPIGEWQYAQGFPYTDSGVKGMNLRERYGWHLSAGLPSAPHLMSSKDFERGYPSKNAFGHPKGSKRVWVRMAYDASVDFNSIADSTKSGDIFGLIPFGGYYAFKENNQSEWVISSAVKIDKILTEEERQQILKDAGYDEYEAWRKKHRATEAEKAESKRNSIENKKAKDKAKKEGLNYLSESAKEMREAIKSRIIDNPEVKHYLRYSERNTGSNRSLIANAIESSVQTEIERKKLQDYRENIDSLYENEDKLSELNRQIKELSFAEGKRDTKKLKELREEAVKTANRINIYDKKLLRLEPFLGNVLDREKVRVRKQEKTKYKASLAEYREKRDAREEAMKAKWKESKEKASVKRKASTVRDKIKSLKKKMEEDLQKPTERRYVPARLVGAIVDVCGLINTDTALIKNNGEVNRAQEKRNQTKEKLQALKDEYEKLQNDADPMYKGEYDETVYAYLSKLKDDYADKNLSDMSLEELTQLYDILRSVYETLRDARKLIGQNEAQSVYEVGDSIAAEQASIAKSRKKDMRSPAQKAKDKSFNYTLSPVRNVERMSGYNEDSALVQLFRDFESGIRKKNMFVMESYKMFQALSTGENSSVYEDAIYKGYGDKTYTDIHGRRFAVSKMEMMQAILTLEREEANNEIHLQKDGISFADLTMLGKGRLKDAVSEEYSHRVPAAVEMIKGFAEELKNDAWAQAYMAAARSFFNKKAKNAINETTMITKHRVIAATKNYIPKEVDRKFITREISADNDIQQTINSYGMLKDTVKNASQPLIMTGLNNVIDRHIEQVGNVYGLSVPVRNFNKVWNVRTNEGRDTVKSLIEKYWGTEGANSIEQTVKDIQGPRISNQSDMYRKLRSNYIGATFLLNLSVVSKQIGSLFAANSMLKYRGPIRMLYNLGYTMKNYKKLSAEVDKYTASVWMRRQGVSDGELYSLMTQGKKSFFGKLNNKLPESIRPTSWIAGMDSAVALSLWKYAKEDVAKRTGLKGEELLKATADYFDSVIENTQSMADVLHRPEVQKRGDLTSDILGMFKTDLYQMAGQLNVTFGRFMANKTAENRAALGRTIYSVAMSAIWGQLMSVLFSFIRYKVKPFRDDDTDEVTFGGVMNRSLFGLLGDLAGYVIPLAGSEAVGVVENIVYGESDEIADNIVTSAVNSLYDAILRTAGKIRDGKALSVSDFSSIATKALQIAGVPANNLYRFGQSINLYAKDIANGEMFSYNAGAELTTANRMSRITNAYTSGKTEMAKNMYEDYLEELAISKAKGEEVTDEARNEAKSSLKSALGKKYKEGDIERDTVIDMLEELFGLDEDEIYWTMDEWDYAAENGSGDDYEKYGEFYEAVETGVNLKAVIKRYTDNGVANKTLAKRITDYYKPKYRAMTKGERAAIKGYLLNAYVYLGYDRNKKSKDIDAWLKDDDEED